MSGDYTLIAIIAGFIGMVIIMTRQQRTIDRLTDKLMARSYGEYKTVGVKEEDASPAREEEPISWHDH